MRIIIGWLVFGGRLVAALPAEGMRHIWKRLPLFLVLWLAAGVLSALHLLGFFLDDIFFRGYRNVAIRCPVFIVGIPRSGTTFLQRVLSDDATFTTLTLWECIFAPSISERYFWSAIGKLASKLTQPLFALLNRRVGLFSRMDKIHRIRLNEPEEDFLLLFFVQACFLVVVPCSNAQTFWRLSRFDDAVGERERKAIMQFYRRCLQRHLYFHGPEKRLLSKNPSFTSFIHSLRKTFPDACFVTCVRDPLEAAPSQLSSLKPAFELMGGGLRDRFNERMLEVLHHYYQVVQTVSRCDDVSVIPMTTLKTRLAQTVKDLYAKLKQPLTEQFIERLKELDTQARAHRSEHRYRADDFALNSDSIRARFADVWPGAIEQAPDETGGAAKHEEVA